jgi:hypothetical protein
MAWGVKFFPNQLGTDSGFPSRPSERNIPELHQLFASQHQIIWRISCPVTAALDTGHILFSKEAQSFSPSWDRILKNNE